MLLSLSIKNFLIIESVYIDFIAAFCVITGQTGAGKSLILDALTFCFGAKIENVIRNNTQICSVTAEFDISQSNQIKLLLDEHEIHNEGQIIISRQETINRRKKFFVNDQQVTQKFVALLACLLVDIHAQHSTTTLLDAKTHLDILDKYAQLTQQVEELNKLYRNWQELDKTIENSSNMQEQNLRDMNYLEFVITELQNAAIKPEEEAKLLQQRAELQQSFNQQKILHQALKLLEDSNFTKIAIQLSKILSKDFTECIDLIDQALINIDEVENILKSKTFNDDLERQVLILDDRLFEIRGLARKHNVASDKLHEFLQDSITKLTQLKAEIDDKENLASQRDEALKEYKLAAENLTYLRIEASKKLEEKINLELSHLISPNASFKVDISELNIEKATSYGLDFVRFAVSVNAGMPHMPIELVASGGELARIMLAIKSVMLEATFKPTIIFDEIDTGVGGAIAEHIGEKLQDLSKISQIISITHQAQIASKAKQHLFVSKSHTEKETFSVIKTLDYQERINEIARMISGKNITPKTLAVAKEMLAL